MMEENSMSDHQDQEDLGGGIGLRGFVRIAGVNQDGEVVMERQSQNKVTDVGREEILQLIAADLTTSAAAVNSAWVGTGATAGPAVGDTNLEASTATTTRTDVTAASFTSGTTRGVRFTWSFAANEVTTATPALAEVGIFNHTSSSQTTMFARSTHSAINKDTSMTLNYTYELQLQTA